MSQLRSIQPIKSGLGLRELQAVLAVAELGSFRRAAAALGYTQSALSHQVSALEAALEQPLFHRPGGRAPVRLTPGGRGGLPPGPAGAQRGRGGGRRRRAGGPRRDRPGPGGRHPDRGGRDHARGPARLPRRPSRRRGRAHRGRRPGHLPGRPAPRRAGSGVLLRSRDRRVRRGHRGAGRPLGHPHPPRQPDREPGPPRVRASSISGTWWPGPAGGPLRPSSRTPGPGAASRPRSSTAPTTTWPCSGWSRPGSATPASGVWRPAGPSTRR